MDLEDAADYSVNPSVNEEVLDVSRTLEEVEGEQAAFVASEVTAGEIDVMEEVSEPHEPPAGIVEDQAAPILPEVAADDPTLNEEVPFPPDA